MEKPFAAYEGPEAYLFACYAHADASIVYPDLLWLTQTGFNIWYDEGIPAGSVWRDEVALAVSQSALIVYFASPRSSASSHCQQELNFALSRERQILCIQLEPTQHTPGLDLALSGSQAINRYEMSEATYRRKLEAGIRRVDATSAFKVLPPPAPVLDTDHSLAVLPLANRGSDPENVYLSDGITEQLIEGLSRLDGLKVRSFFAVAPYRERQLPPAEIGRQLGIASIVSGSLQRVGNRVRVTATLTRTEDGANLWSQHYDNDLEDIFALQDDVAQQIVAALHPHLGSTRSGPIIEVGTGNVRAYESFLLGRHELTKRTSLGYQNAIRHFKRAVALDPDWVDPRAELAQAFFQADLLSTTGGNDAAFIGLREAAAQLAEVDPTKACLNWFRIDAHLAMRDQARQSSATRSNSRILPSLSRYVILHEGDYSPGYVADAYRDIANGACRIAGLYECALQLHQAADARRRSDYYGAYERAVMLAGLGRFDLAIDACSEALEGNPGELFARFSRCVWLTRTGQYGRAALDLDVLNDVLGPDHFAAFCNHFWRGEHEAAQACANRMEMRQHSDWSRIYKALAAMLLGDLSRGLDHVEACVKDEPFFGLLLRWFADVHLTTSIRTALSAAPRWRAALAAVRADDHSRRMLIGEINELSERTLIRLDEHGVPTTT